MCIYSFVCFETTTADIFICTLKKKVGENITLSISCGAAVVVVVVVVVEEEAMSAKQK